MIYLTIFLLLCAGILTVLTLLMLFIFLIRPLILKSPTLTKLASAVSWIAFLLPGYTTVLIAEDMAKTSDDKLKKLLKQAALIWLGLIIILAIIYFLGGFKNFFEPG